MSTIRKVVGLLACAALLLPAAANATSRDSLPPADQLRLVRIETKLSDQTEAADRQGEAFDAAVNRIEIVNLALVCVIALAGVGGSILAVRWVRHEAREQIAGQVKTVVQQAGENIFESEAASLREEYEDKFTTLYRRYQRLADDE